jgi:hypothetical protein
MRNATHRTTPSQRWTKMADRVNAALFILFT